MWAAYCVVPNDAGGWLDGVPIGRTETIALLMLAWLAARRAALTGAAVVGVLRVITWAAGAAIPGSGGMRARYYANDTASGSHERSTEFRDAAFTRIDRLIDFIPRQRDFPLAFFNDIGRFNFYLAGQPQRHLMGFAVRWSGLWWADGSRELYLDAPGAHAAIAIDGVDFLEVGPDSGVITRGMDFPRGWHRLDIVFRAPYGSSRRFGAGEVRAGTPRPFDAGMVVTQQIREWQLQAYHALRMTKRAIDVGVLVWLAWLFATVVAQDARRLLARPVAIGAGAGIAVLAMAGAIDALRVAWPWAGRLLVMVGGDDPMTYEWYARDIQMNGLLMNGGRPLGEGEPFYYQAFYPYFLAATHALFGEGMFGVLFLQRALGVWLAILLTLIAIRLAGARVWAAALACSAGFVWWKFFPIASDLLSESLYIPLLAAATLATIAAAQQPATASAMRAGLLTGVATITRTTALLAWPAMLLAGLSGWQVRRDRRRLIAIMLGAAIVVFSLIAVRNWLVSRQVSLTSTEFGVTLLGGNIPPEGLTIDGSPRFELYRRLALNESTARVIEYAITHPLAFSDNMARKALFALGIYEPYAPGWGLSPVYIMVWTSALAGMAVGRMPGAPPGIFLLPALVALSQYAAVVLVYPKGERLILPIHTLLVPYSAMAVTALVTRLRGSSRAN